MTIDSLRLHDTEKRQPQTLVGRTIQSMRDRDVSGLALTLNELNMQLTGLDRGGNFRNPNDVLTTVGQLFSESDKNKNVHQIVYLGDSGLSRLVMFIRSGECDIRLDENTAQEKVKAEWKKLKDQYEAVDKRQS